MDKKKKKKKKALIVGLSYRDDPVRTLMRGPINSAVYLKKLLMKEFEFSQKDITLVTDALGKTPTDKEIINHLLNLLANAQPGDIFLFYYIGHGGRRESKEYNNNSGYIEYISLGKNAEGVKTFISDNTLRHIVEPLPQGCSFTFMADCCCSGALLEGATEIFGSSTQFPVTDKIPAPMTEHLDLKRVDLSNCRKLGILFSACQSFETTGGKYCDVKRKQVAYFTDTVIAIINKFGVNISNRFLFEKIKEAYVEDGKEQSPGLYCDISQVDLLFLSLEEAETSQLPENSEQAKLTDNQPRE
ncbi:metacaspase-5-like [Trifolium pratense]|uniref:metacaspase-5-like n=1 Tax=Trifolium pratense TaxID=57577 RepID=UPI001E6913F6|nr:metacaspase-5-like [Trifolium pratense]XP_045810048.1 metacaspase-5-like [Trifolium pratense]XP_045810050.1 metacaspase-5-like [Trifolium pratense]